jgi:hypothetical protein
MPSKPFIREEEVEADPAWSARIWRVLALRIEKLPLIFLPG